jgi:hypothetical protein
LINIIYNIKGGIIDFSIMDKEVSSALEDLSKDKSLIPSLFKQCICEGLLQIFYNEENFKPKQVFITQNALLNKCSTNPRYR